MWRVELVNIWTMSIWPIHIFVTARRLILACMNKPFREARYLAVSQRGRRSCPRIWLSVIESKRCQHLGKGTQPFLLSVLVDKKAKRINTTAWRDFCERMLRNAKGGTCQHLDYEHMANSHLCHCAAIDTCLREQIFSRNPVFGSAAERQAQLPPQLAKCNWIEKDGGNILAKVLGLVSVSPHRKENMSHQVLFFKPWSDKGWKSLAQHWKPWKPLKGLGNFAFYYPFLSYNMLPHVGAILQAPKAFSSCSKVEGPTFPLSAAMPWSSEQMRQFSARFDGCNRILAAFRHGRELESDTSMRNSNHPVKTLNFGMSSDSLWSFWKNKLPAALVWQRIEALGAASKTLKTVERP